MLRAARGLGALLRFCALAILGAITARAAEDRDPAGRFTIALPDGFAEVPRTVLEQELNAARRAGPPVPASQAAFDRGAGPRPGYPAARLGVVSPDAAWTTADLETILGQMQSEQGARDAAAALDRVSRDTLAWDPTVTFVRWDPARQTDVPCVTARSTGKEVEGAGRIAFGRGGWAALLVGWRVWRGCRS